MWSVTDYEAQAKPITIPEKKFKTDFLVHYLILSITL